MSTFALTPVLCITVINTLCDTRSLKKIFGKDFFSLLPFERHINLFTLLLFRAFKSFFPTSISSSFHSHHLPKFSSVLLYFHPSPDMIIVATVSFHNPLQFISVSKYILSSHGGVFPFAFRFDLIIFSSFFILAYILFGGMETGREGRLFWLSQFLLLYFFKPCFYTAFPTTYEYLRAARSARPPPSIMNNFPVFMANRET